MYKGYKVRLYPTKEQEGLLWKHIHTCRFIWNYMLEQHNKNYELGNKFMSAFTVINMLKPLKKQDEFKWLKEVSNASLVIVCRDLDLAFKRYFTRVCRFPKFKSRKKSKNSYPVRADVFKITDSYTQVEKIGKIKIKKINVPTGKICNPRITYINNKWILSFQVKYENQVFNEKTSIPMGIDLGVKELAVVSFGDKKYVYHNINKSKRVRELEKKLVYLCKVVQRKYRVNGSYDKSKSILRYEKMIKDIYYKLSNIRNNHIHQITHSLVGKLPMKVTMETLDVVGLMKNKHMSSKIGKQCFNVFITQMKYKCEWNGIEFVQANRSFPSSKMCSFCGSINKDLKLSDRVYNCKECGAKIDRDYNAAINLMRYVPPTERCTA